MYTTRDTLDFESAKICPKCFEFSAVKSIGLYSPQVGYLKSCIELGHIPGLVQCAKCAEVFSPSKVIVVMYSSRSKLLLCDSCAEGAWNQCHNVYDDCKNKVPAYYWGRKRGRKYLRRVLPRLGGLLTVFHKNAPPSWFPVHKSLICKSCAKYLFLCSRCKSMGPYPELSYLERAGYAAGFTTCSSCSSANRGLPLFLPEIRDAYKNFLLEKELEGK